ncbi:MAG: helix-turn-helix transcriptional regulator [Planctomycetes bacterium]|nr:helix-turn-helix transcriptional regulator [Planctomycetota bacterium]
MVRVRSDNLLSAQDMGSQRHGEWHIQMHSHPHYEVLYIIEGQQFFLHKGKEYNAGDHDVVIYEPGGEHEEFSRSDSFIYFCLRFSKSEIRQAGMSFPHLNGPVVNMGERHMDMQILCDRYCAESQQPGLNSAQLSLAYLTQFCVMLDRQVHGHEKPQWDGSADDARTRIHQALDKIHNSIGAHLELHDLAAHAKMSVSHFSRLFKKEYGESPKKYLIRQRMEKAKSMLRESDESGQEIARQLGYDNTYFFYRQFKQYTGMTSTEYRAS